MVQLFLMSMSFVHIDAALKTILVSMDLSLRALFLMRCLATRDINLLSAVRDKILFLLIVSFSPRVFPIVLDFLTSKGSLISSGEAWNSNQSRTGSLFMIMTISNLLSV